MPPRGESRIRAIAQLSVPLIVGVVALTTVVAACVYMVWDARTQVELRAKETAESVVQLLGRDIGRNIEVLDLSLQAVTEGVARPEIMRAERSFKKMILFDRSASASGLGALIVFDKDGNNILDSLHDEPVGIKPVTDRDYFQAQVESDKGLFISRAYESRLLKTPVIGLSRRINDAEGHFLGVALATIEINYLSELISRIKLGPGAVVSVLRSDGVVLLRQGQAGIQTNLDVSGMSAFQRISKLDSGILVNTSQYDGIERLYGFQRVGKYPLLISVGIATSTIYADWQQKTIMLILLVAVMTVVVLGLLVKLLGELKLKAAAEERLVALNHELERLSLTDALTGLANRRHFDEMFGRECRRSHRTRQPLSLALIDIDHFKLFNDTYGHAEGDATLKLVANALKACLKKPGDMAFRVGGEEFAVILPQTGEAGAISLGEAMCEAVRSLHREHRRSETGSVTISVGFSVETGLEPAIAYEVADRALYEAKQSGRNRVKRHSLPLAG